MNSPQHSAATLSPQLSQTEIFSYQQQGTKITASFSGSSNQSAPFEIVVVGSNNQSVGAIIYGTQGHTTDAQGKITFTVVLEEYDTSYSLNFTNTNNSDTGSAAITGKIFETINITVPDGAIDKVDQSTVMTAYMVVKNNELWPNSLKLNWVPGDAEANNYMSRWQSTTNGIANDASYQCSTKRLTANLFTSSKDGGVLVQLGIAPVTANSVGINITQLVPFGGLEAPYLDIGGQHPTTITQDIYDAVEDNYFPFYAPSIKDVVTKTNPDDNFTLYAQILDTNGNPSGSPIFLKFALATDLSSTARTLLAVTTTELYPVAQYVATDFNLYYIYERGIDGTTATSPSTRMTLSLDVQPGIVSSGDLAAPQPNISDYKNSNYVAADVLGVTVPFNGNRHPKENDWIQVYINVTGQTVNTNGQVTILSLNPYQIKAGDVTAGQVVFDHSAANDPQNGFLPPQLFNIELATGSVYYLFWEGKAGQTSPQGDSITSLTTPIIINTVLPHHYKPGKNNG